MLKNKNKKEKNRKGCHTAQHVTGNLLTQKLNLKEDKRTLSSHYKKYTVELRQLDRGCNQPTCNQYCTNGNTVNVYLTAMPHLRNSFLSNSLMQHFRLKTSLLKYHFIISPLNHLFTNDINLVFNMSVNRVIVNGPVKISHYFRFGHLL